MKTKQTKKHLSKLKKTLHRHVKLTFVPHKANQYRPHLIRRHGLVALLVVVIAMQVGYNFSTSGTVLGERTTVTTDELLSSTNKERAQVGLGALKMNEKLGRAATLKAKSMFQQQYWAHNAPDGTTPWQWFKAAGYEYQYAGENLAKNFHTSESVTMAWLSSPEHRANVLGEQYSNVGFAVAEGILGGSETTLVVALYGTPATGSVAGAQVSSSAPVDKPMGLVTKLGVAVQSMTPAVLGSIALLFVGVAVGLVAHMYRSRLPKKLRQSWYRHHGLLKVGGMISLCFVLIVLYSGGQI